MRASERPGSGSSRNYAGFVTPGLTSPDLTFDKRVIARSLKQAETTREQIGGLVLFAMELQR